MKYQNLKVERLVKLLEDWKKSDEKYLKESKKLNLNNVKYWEGKIDAIDNMLEVINIFK